MLQVQTQALSTVTQGQIQIQLKQEQEHDEQEHDLIGIQHEPIGGQASASATDMMAADPSQVNRLKLPAADQAKLIVDDVKRRKRSLSKDAANSEVKGYPCYFPDCGKVFTRPSHLKKHLYIHTGERPHKCSYCSDAFKTKWTLKKHIRTHTGEKPFSCSTCKMDFTQRGSWRRHMLAHDAQAVHRCPCCTKTFKQLANLTKHIRSAHNDQKVFKCSMCTMRFKCERTLGKHMSSTHPKARAKMFEAQQYYCPYCHGIFPSTEECTGHMRSNCESAPATRTTPFVKTGTITTGPPPIFYGTQSVLS